MVKVLDVERLGIPVVALPGAGGEMPRGSCAACETYRPDPRPDGSLLVDPEIRLPSPGMDVDVAYYYDSRSVANGPFGYGRTINLNLTAQASGSPTAVVLTKGDGSLVKYLNQGGTGSYVCQTPGVVNVLTEDIPNGLWKETTPDGLVTAYPRNITGMVTSVTYAEDACGNRHTFGYTSGLLTSLQDAVGRLVTLAYASNRLTSITDWAGRVTTFQYDTSRWRASRC